MAHEQFTPSRLLHYSRVGEEAGFDWVWSSDHFHPWFETRASAGFAWTWMSAALSQIPRVRFGTAVTPPYLRYHPALVAQAFATMGVMFPGRVFAGVGLGEAMNEVPLGYRWGDVPTRVAMFEEALRVIRLLWNGGFVDFEGKYFSLKGAKLYTLPKRRVPLIVVTNHPAVAEIAGKYADGLYTSVTDTSRLQNSLFPALERGAKSAGRDSENLIKGLHLGGLSLGTRAEAVKAYSRWRGSFVKNVFAQNVFDPREIEKMGASIPEDELVSHLLISRDPEAYLRRTRTFLEMGFDHIVFGSAGPRFESFLRFVGARVLPTLRNEFNGSH